MTFKREGVANIAVLRALRGLGDMLTCVPALRALSTAYPSASVTLIGLPESRWVADRFPAYVDRFVEFPGWPGLPERLVAGDCLAALLSAMSAEGFDLAVQMHGSGAISNAVIAALNAKTAVGFVPNGTDLPENGLFARYPTHLPEIHRCLRLAGMVGADVREDSLEFPTLPLDRAEAARVWPGAEEGAYVCIHPGSSSPDRRWPAERFAEVADGLSEQGWRVVLTGTAGEAELTASVAGAAKAGVVDLAGRTTLGGLAALVSGARCVVCNDTGVSHLAEALRAPSVVVFPKARSGPIADPSRWAPLDGRLHRVLHECTAVSRCRDDIECMREVWAEDVVREARALMGEATYVG